MTLLLEDVLVQYEGNSSTTVWPFPFRVDEASSVRVMLIDQETFSTELISNAEYNLNGVGNPDGGSVVYPLSGSPVPSTKWIVIIRRVPYIQEMRIRNQAGFHPEVLEATLDHIVMQTQQLAEMVSRALLIPPGMGSGDFEDIVSVILQAAGASVEAAEAAAASAAAAATSEANAEEAAQFAMQAAGLVVSSTWSGLSGLNGTHAGQPGRVAGNDGGTHIDPVTAETVPNQGEYSWSGTDWEWVAPLNYLRDNSVLPSALTTRDFSDTYLDPETEDIHFYSITGSDAILRSQSTSEFARTARYQIYHPLEEGEVVLTSKPFVAFSERFYQVQARATFTVGLQTARELWIDWFSDWDAEELIQSDLIHAYAAGGGSARQLRSMQAPEGTVRARFRAVKLPSTEPARMIITELSFRRALSSDDLADEAVTPAKLSVHDWDNIYPDPEMGELSLYTIVGAPAVQRFEQATAQRSRYIIFHEVTTEEVTITSGLIPVEPRRVYEVAARSSFTTDLPVERAVYLDWFSDWAGEELISSTLINRWGPTDGATMTKMLRAPAGVSRARFRGVKEESTEPTRIILGNFAMRTVAAQNQTVRYADAEARRTLEINDNTEEGGVFPRTVDQELETMFGGNISLSRPPLAATDLGQIMFIPPTEEQMNFTGPTVPRMTWQGINWRVIPMDVRVSLMNTAVAPAIFNPHLTNNSGMLVFNYFRSDPIHSVLSGTIDMMARVSLDDPDARARFILGLRTFDYPYLEEGQSRGRRYLGQSFPALEEARQILDVEAYNDPCAPIDDFILNLFPSGSPNLYEGSEPGYIDGAVDGGAHENLVLDNPPGSGNMVGPEVQTLSWINIENYDPQDHVFAITFDGTSNRSRIQWRDAGGNIHYFDGHSMDSSSYRLIRLPRRAVAFRVYYTGIGQTAGDNNVDIRALTGAARAYDPLKGYFQNYRFAVNRDVTLWPNSQYAFFLHQESYAGADPVTETAEWGFRFLSGGLNMLFDASRLRKELAATLYQTI